MPPQIAPSPRDRLIHILTFDVPIKFICPPALLGLFVNQAIVDATAYSNGYEDYPDWLHSVAGTLVLGLMFGALILFAVYPDFWDVLGVDENAGQPVANYDLLQQVRPRRECMHAHRLLLHPCINLRRQACMHVPIP